jgi:hypothetical protein
MEKVHRVIVSFFVICFIVIAGLYAISLQDKRDSPPVSGNVFYYGITCPHCKIVEAFISENNITNKLIFESKEVYENTNNANELISLGKYCKLQMNYVGAVPLLFFNNTCYLGDVDIINFLNKTMEINTIK